MHRVFHVSHDTTEHVIGLIGFTPYVFQDARFAFADDKRNINRLGLPKSIAPSDSLIVLLVAVAWKANYVAAMLPVQSPGSNLRLNDKPLNLPRGKRR
jgi:hypothetical protein